MNILNTIQKKIENIFYSKDERFDAFYNSYYRRIYVYISNFNINNDDVSEITQNVFLKIYENFDNIDHSKNSSSYIFKIARNTVFDFFRRQKRTIITQEFDENNYFSEEIHTTDFFSIEELQNIIKELGETEKELLFLKYREELSYREIANIIQISESKVKSRLYEIRKKLRCRWEELYG